MPERPNGAVSKTVVVLRATVGSNPTLSATRAMKPRITVITLGVNDLEESLAFYRDGLGLPTAGIFGTEFEHGAVAFFDPDGHLWEVVWNPEMEVAD